jgi:hypothetical protein
MAFARSVRVFGIAAAAAIVLGGCIRFAPPEPVATSGTLADITGDGTADILGAIAGGGSGFQRYEYCGTGCLTPKEVVSGDPLRFVADFNNDNRDDVITGNFSTYTLYFGSASGLSAANSVAIPPGAERVIDGVGDFNGDGKTDLLRGDSYFNGTLIHEVVALGNGAGGFTDTTFGTAIPVGETGPSQIDIGDVNGDGRDDLVATAVGRIQVAKFGGAQCDIADLRVTCPYIDQTLSAARIVVGDIDGDGKTDLARYQFSTNSIDFFRSTGTGFTPFPAFQTISVPVSRFQFQMQLRDIDNDGITDFLLNDNVNTRTWWSGTNDGGFPYAAKTDVPLGATGCAGCFGDVNNDGRVDAVVGGQLWISTSEDTSG